MHQDIAKCIFLFTIAKRSIHDARSSLRGRGVRLYFQIAKFYERAQLNVIKGRSAITLLSIQTVYSRAFSAVAENTAARK